MRAPFCGLVVLFLASGCDSSRDPSLAYVDVNRVARADAAFKPNAPTIPQPPTAVASSHSTMPPLKSARLDFSENAARLSKVRQAVEAAREETVREVTRKLREAYQREIDSIEAKREITLEPGRTTALTRAWSLVRNRFMAYADARAPHVVRIALYAGFPDPDPNSSRPPEASQKALLRRFERAQASRANLAELESGYENDVRKLLAQYDDEVAAAVTAMRVEIEKLRADAEDRARQDARAQVEKLQAQIESVLSGRAVVDLPARPGVASSTPGGGAIPPAPEVIFPSKVETEKARLDAVRSEAQIWAAHRGIELVDSAARGQDLTGEFMAWRKQRRLGR